MDPNKHMVVTGMGHQLYGGSSNSSPGGASPAGVAVSTGTLRLGLHHGAGLLSSGETEPSSESSSTGTSSSSVAGGDSPYNNGAQHQQHHQQRNLSRPSSRIKPTVEQQQMMQQQMNGLIGVKQQQQQQCDELNKTDKYDGRHSSSASSGSSASGGYPNSNDTRQTVLMWGSSTGNTSAGSCHSNDGSVSMTTADLITSTTATAYAAGIKSPAPTGTSLEIP